MASNGTMTIANAEHEHQLAATELVSRLNFDAALGPLRAHIEDSRTTDVNVNPDGSVWVSRGTLGKFRAPERMDARQRETLIGMLANRAGSVVDRLHSRLAMDLPYYGARVQCFAPPIGQWALCIRVHAPAVVALADRAGMMAGGFRPAPPATAPRGYAAAIAAAVERLDNIAIAGRPGAGKTSLLNSMLQESARLRPDARIVTLEDRVELRPSHGDALSLYAKVEQANPDGSRYEYSFSDLLADALRTSFDVLAFGELRDAQSAIALLMAMNCGVSGLMFTLHATSALDVLTRLEDLVRLAGAPVIRRTIARFVNAIVFLDMDDARERRVADVIRVFGADDRDEYVIERVAA